MRIPPIGLLRDIREQHDAEAPKFDPMFDGFGWKRLSETDYEPQLMRHESGFPCYPEQFVEILKYMRPHEVWARIGEEIRFVWVNGSVRKSLDFVRIEHQMLPTGIKVQLLFDIDGVEHWRFWASVSEFCVLPERGELPPRIIFSRTLDYMPVTSTVVLAVMRRGFGGYDNIEPRAHTLWVG